MNSLHGLLNCEIGGLACHVITTEYKTRVHCIHMKHLFLYYVLILVIYSVVSGQYSHVYNTRLEIKMSVLCCSCVQESLPLSGAGSSMKGVSKGDSLMIVCRFQVGTVSFPYFRLFKCVRVSSLDGRYLYNMYIHVHVV